MEISISLPNFIWIKKIGILACKPNFFDKLLL